MQASTTKKKQSWLPTNLRYHVSLAGSNEDALVEGGAGGLTGHAAVAVRVELDAVRECFAVVFPGLECSVIV